MIFQHYNEVRRRYTRYVCVCLSDHRTFRYNLPVCQRVCRCVFVISKHSCQLTQKKASLDCSKVKSKIDRISWNSRERNNTISTSFRKHCFWVSLYVKKLFIANSISREFSHGLNMYGSLRFMKQNCNAGWFVCLDSFDSLFDIHSPYSHIPQNQRNYAPLKGHPTA